jgi:hypothetical protein
MKSPFGGKEEGGWGEAVHAKNFPDDSIFCFVSALVPVSCSVAVEVLHFFSPASGTNKI